MTVIVTQPLLVRELQAGETWLKITTNNTFLPFFKMMMKRPVQVSSSGQLAGSYWEDSSETCLVVSLWRNSWTMIAILSLACILLPPDLLASLFSPVPLNWIMTPYISTWFFRANKNSFYLAFSSSLILLSSLDGINFSLILEPLSSFLSYCLRSLIQLVYEDACWRWGNELFYFFFW